MDIELALAQPDTLRQWAREASSEELRTTLRNWRKLLKEQEPGKAFARVQYLQAAVIRACHSQHAKQEALAGTVSRWVMMEHTDSPRLIEKYLRETEEDLGPSAEMTILVILSNPNLTGKELERITRIARERTFWAGLEGFKKQERFGGACDYQFLKKHGFPAADIEKTQTIKALEANWEGTLDELLKAAEELGPCTKS